jgi:hypothetical protein
VLVVVLLQSVQCIAVQSSGEEVSERFNRPTKSRSESLTVK